MLEKGSKKKKKCWDDIFLTEDMQNHLLAVLSQNFL